MFLKVSNSEARFHPNIKKGYKVQLPTRQLFILSTCINDFGINHVNWATIGHSTTNDIYFKICTEQCYIYS